MKWLAIIVLVGALGACGRCGGDGDPVALPAVTDESGEVVTVPMPGAVYKEAFERARAEVTVDNASERLNELEQDIDREAEAMH